MMLKLFLNSILINLFLLSSSYAKEIPPSPLGTAASAATSIQNITPSQGPITGGTQVTLTGSGFTGTTMTFDGAAVTPISASDTQIVFQTPVHSNGIASIKLSGNGPNTYAEFLYLPPSLQSLPAGYITTVMGIGQFRGDGRLATNAVLDVNDAGLAVASDGSIYLSEHNQNVIRRVRTDGIIERYAGTGKFGDSVDGAPALNVNLPTPRGLAFDSAGNLLIGGVTNAMSILGSIRRIDAQTGIMTTLYGGTTDGFSGDGGPATSAQFNDPVQIAFDGSGNLYVLDRLNVRIRKIDTKGIITTIAGTGVTGFSGDGGPATQATFNTGINDWGGLAADSKGNVYLADSVNNRVRRIDGATGIITTLIGDAGNVYAVLTDSTDNVYIGMNNNVGPRARILKMSPIGQLLQSWGVGYGFSEDGTAVANAPLCMITRLALDHSGNILFNDACSGRIRRINVTTGLLETIAGMGPHIIGETGPALATVLPNSGMDLLFLPSGDLLTAEGANYRIRKLDQQGNVSAFAGNGFMGIGGQDGVPALESFMDPNGLGMLPNGDILMDNIAGISRIDNAGIIHAVNYLHHYGYSGDGGPAISAIMDEPWDLNTDAAGNIYIADTNNNRIRRIDAQTGIINTVAGSGPVNGFENYGKGSYCGDGGPATSACLNTPYGIALAPDGTMYIGENGQHIRKVTPDGIITTFFSGGGKRLRLSSAGNLFMPNYRIQPNGHAYKFAFQNPDQSADIEDGVPARSTQANFLGGFQGGGVSIDSEGNLFLDDNSNRRIRVIRYGAVIAEFGSTVTASGGNNQTTPIRTAFPMVLQVTLKSPEGTLENGIRVDFTAPASGASCTFPGGGTTYSTLTDTAGHASVTCTANAQLGSYSVTATPLALNQSASFSLTNSVVAEPGSFQVTSPNGGETWMVGSSHNITWTNTGTIANVKLEYSTNNGTNWTTIIASTANTNSYAWTVPAASSTNCLIRVSEAATGTPADVSNAIFSIVPGPNKITLSKTSLAFGAVAGGTSTSSQMIVVSNTGAGTLSWTAASNNTWLGVTPGSGTGTGVIQVSVNAAGLDVGTNTGTIAVSDPNATNSPQTIAVTLKVIGPSLSAQPFGDYSTPLDGTIGISGAIPVTGWALDDIEVTKVEINRDPVTGDPPAAIGPDGLVYLGDAIFVEGARPDVETAYPGYPLNYRAGWGYMLLTNFLPNQGNGTFKIHAYAYDKEGNKALLGTKTITCSNATAVKPFGTIDTPAQGGNASGNAYVNFGWVLTPLPNTVPTDGSTITAWVDGVQVGVLKNAPNAYNQYRADIAGLFPGLKNSGGPVGFVYLNTTLYSNGVHTIYWIGTDDAGHADGIGSRYFNVMNTGTPSPQSNLAVQVMDFNGSVSYDAVMNLPVSFELRRVKRGFDLNAEPDAFQPDEYGVVHIDLREVERVELDLKPLSGEISAAFGASEYTGFLVVGNQLRSLPIGSTLDQRKGTFSWLPGPGFLGKFELLFVRKDKTGMQSKIRFDVKIIPKFNLN